MKVKTKIDILKIVVLGLVFAIWGCSSAQQETNDLQADSEETEQDQQQEADDELSEDDQEEDGIDELSEEITQAVPDEQVSAPPVADMSQRVVRYVGGNNVYVYTSASVSSGKVGTLRKGDVVMVSVEGDWGLLSGGKYVQIKELSAKAVARARSRAVWSTPAH